MSAVELKGIAWNHTRGFLPVVATAQRYEELHPEVRIIWEKRSLQAFADMPMNELAARYDLIVMDHPHTSMAASQGLLLPFNEWLSPAFLDDQANNSVGQSHVSYQFKGKQWTLVTDAAAPVSTWRPDLVEKYNISLPQTWEQLLDLAKSGYVSLAAYPIDLLMHTYMLVEALGHPPFSTEEGIGPEELVAVALEHLRELTSYCEEECFERNPIMTAEFMASEAGERRATYCPFAYSYSNYSRLGYAQRVLHAGDLVSFEGRLLRSTLGGAGLAVSAATKQPERCMDYCRFSASSGIQRGIYFDAGGQPGHRSAWLDIELNRRSSNFFAATLPVLDRAICRPQHLGYMRFQDAASPLAHRAVRGQLKSKEAARQLRQVWLSSNSVDH